jgi:pimeloyl-ACP methyl ester carboxylesterase
MMRKWLLRVGGALVIGALVYMGVAAWALHRVATQILEVGGVMALAEDAPSPADPLTIGYRGTPREGLGLDYSEVSVMSELGALPGWWVPAGPDAPMAALYLHGIGGAREDGYRFVPVLNESGIPVLLTTYRGDPGAPEIEGGAHAFGLSEWRDVEAAMRWLGEQGHDKVLLVADSMGAALAGQFLARSPGADRVAGLALDSPALDFPAILENLGRRMGIPLPGLAARGALLLLARARPDDLAQARVTGVIAGFTGPLFLVHGTGDRIVPVALSDALLTTRQGETLHLRGTADHLGLHAEMPEAHSDAFGRFVRQVR